MKTVPAMSRGPIDDVRRADAQARVALLAVDNGVGVVTVAGEKADCVITAEPVAFLLVGFGRVPQWSQLIRGKITAGGRKPWLAAKFGTLLEGA